jgi:hypothetical protein
MAGWATSYIEALQRGESVEFRPRGGSMTPRIRSGQLCFVEPTTIEAVEVDDVVLCTVRGLQYLHLVKAKQGPRLLIGNNHGNTNGWISANGLHGKLVRLGDR